jgi:hypothetical protein
MKKFFLVYVCVAGMFASVQAQGNLLPEGSAAAHELERMHVLYGMGSLHTDIFPYRRSDGAQMALEAAARVGGWQAQYLLDDHYAWLSVIDPPHMDDATGLRKVYTDSTKTFYRYEAVDQGGPSSMTVPKINARPLLKTFYKTPGALYYLDVPGFKLTVNPLLRGAYARASGQKEPYFLNQRGVAIAGQIDSRIYVDLNILESQVRLPEFIEWRIKRDRAFPGAGSFTNYKSLVFNVVNGHDFLLSQGLIGAQLTKHVGFQAGHGRHHIGDGYRSMLLSNFGNNYFFLRLNTRVWKLHYQNIFAELKASSVKSNRPGRLVPPKFMAAHYLSFKPFKNVHIGLFETVVFSRNRYELEYLNPVILYRTVEEQLGSPDNVLIGLNGRWDIAQHVTLYGQLALDEFKLDRIVARNGWWGNKFGVQAGAKYFDAFGVNGLFLQAEANMARPYTYTHADSLRNYTHYRQPLAHPMGANFAEAMLFAQYQPNKRWLFDVRLNAADLGVDIDSTNYGSDLNLPYTTRWRDTGNTLGQGTPLSFVQWSADVSYALYHNVWLDFQFNYRHQRSTAKDLRFDAPFFGVGLRANMQKWRSDF